MSTELPPGKFIFSNYDDAHVVQVPRGRITVTGMQPWQFAADQLASLPCLTLGAAILNVGPGVEDGQIVESVAPPWLAFIEMFKRNPESIYRLDPRQWEEMIAGAYVADGYDEVVLTPRSGDGGRDVIATKKGFCSIRIFNQVKAYRPGHVVTADDVRALAGTLAGFNNVSKGFVTTTSTFAPKIGEDRGLVNLIPFRIQLRSRDELLPWLAQLQTNRAR